MKQAVTNLGRVLVAVVLFVAVAPVYAQPEQPVYNRSESMIPMRDGVRLHTRIYTPTRTTEQLPILLLRTPYGIRDLSSAQLIHISAGDACWTTALSAGCGSSIPITEATPKQRWLALSDLTKQDGEIVMIVKANGQPIKSYKTRVVGGRLQTLERNRLDTEPRTAFISPRYVDLTDRSRSDFTMRDMFWIKKSP